ncbi:MAG: hypothetical protein KIG50_00240 [Lachnospiraceae bacterium]|nr:hypothetical protein [Lachnospiraceae bacterium]
MDKYEYKLRSEEIKSLIKEREFTKAVEIADTIDWSRVRSVSMLCTISDLYKINRRYKEAKDLLLQAYEKYPGGRTILYSLCELCIKTDDVLGAIEYYKEFVQLAPTDNGKFVLQYKIYEAQDVSLEERIAVLEELKKRDYREKWGYELAYLYHRIGLGTKCVEECDELILWFREGKYIKKAMELKMLHQPLTEEQETLYKRMLPNKEKEQYEQQTKVFDGSDAVSKEQEIQVKTVDVSKYNTINLQKELAESMKEVLVADNAFSPLYSEEEEEPAPVQQPEEIQGETDIEEIVKQMDTGMIEVTGPVDMQVEVLPEEELNIPEEADEHIADYVPGSITEAIMAPMMQDTDCLQELIIEDGKVVAKEPEIETEEKPDADSKGERLHSGDLSDTAAIRLVEAAKEPISSIIREQVEEAVENAIREERPSIREVMKGRMSNPDLSQVSPPDKMGHLLSQEYDGQISLVVPEGEPVEKQITGQLNLEDILAEWEKTKKENEEKRKRKTQQRLLQQTGTMFTEFEEKVRDGILEKLEKSEELPKEEEIEVLEELPEEEETEDILKTAESEEEFEEIEEIEEIEESEITDNTEALTENSQGAEKAQKEEEIELEEEFARHDSSESERYEEPVRNMTEEEISLFAPFVQTKGARVRLMKSLDQISLAAYTGNVFVTGETPEEAVELAKSVVREVQMTDRNFSGKVAKVTGHSLNNRDIEAMVSRLANGALIIEKAAAMEAQTTKDLLKALNQEKTGIVVVLQDTKKARHKMMEYFSGMKDIFNVHIEVEELGDDALVAYGKKYARYLEYSIDEMGVLALHTKIDEMQTADHIVTVADVRDIVDEAIEHANRKNLRHFADVLFARRYDDDDMIILRERDFLE